jgi:hypothetical protein
MANKLTGWMIFQVLVGIWLLVSPYVLEFKGPTSATTNTMVFGAVVILVGLGMFLFREQVCGMEHPVKKG